MILNRNEICSRHSCEGTSGIDCILVCTTDNCLEIGKPVRTLVATQAQTVKMMCKAYKTYLKGKSSEDFKFYVVQRGRTTHEVRREN